VHAQLRRLRSAHRALRPRLGCRVPPRGPDGCLRVPHRGLRQRALSRQPTVSQAPHHAALAGQMDRLISEPTNPTWSIARIAERCPPYWYGFLDQRPHKFPTVRLPMYSCSAISRAVSDCMRFAWGSTSVAAARRAGCKGLRITLRAGSCLFPCRILVVSRRLGPASS